jgi:hypothetical protein
MKGNQMTSQSAINSENKTCRYVLWGAALLAVLAALGYILISLRLLPIGEYTNKEGPVGILYTAAGCYLVGGLLILIRKRWLWVIGAVINALVIFIFVQMYVNHPSILLSPGGLVTKLSQICVEIGLIYLIFTFRGRPREKTPS